MGQESEDRMMLEAHIDRYVAELGKNSHGYYRDIYRHFCWCAVNRHCAMMKKRLSSVLAVLLTAS